MKKDYEANYSEYISTLDDDKFCLDKKKSLFTKILAKTFLPIINFFLFLSQGFLMAVHGVKVSLLIKWLREKRFAIFEAKK
ncbi:MAG TPA: hypothetical protein ENN64_00110 [bacterium]|nr:hypothetical protein [bacterium]